MWYVVQVQTGKEDQLIADLSRHCDPGLLKEVFSPTYEVQKHLAGEWRTTQQRMFPGYVIVDTKKPESLARVLRRMSQFARLLGTDEGFVPLAQQEQRWIAEFSGAGRRVIQESSGIIVGDEVRVLTGPLVGQEARIKKVNRRKRLAFLEMDICGRQVNVKVGLSIVKKVEAQD